VGDVHVAKQNKPW